LTEQERYLKLLIHGDYGTGKTRLCASSVLVESMRDILVIDAESGDLTITTEPLFKPYAHNFSVIKIKDFKAYARIQEFLKLHCQYRDMNSPEGDAKLKDLERILFPAHLYNPETPPKKFYTVITDSLSEIEAYSLNQILGHSDRSRIDEDAGTPEWAHYRQNLSQILRAIRAYRDLPMHVLFTCASHFSQDELKRMIWSPMLTGKLSRQCQGFMDIVGFMTVSIGDNGQKVHNMQVQPTPKINAKCRFSNFKQVGWSDPTMKSILESVGLLVATPKAAAPVKP
jgi:hypothetical protein